MVDILLQIAEGCLMACNCIDADYGIVSGYEWKLIKLCYVYNMRRKETLLEGGP